MKIHRVTGMLIFAFTLLFFGWYWHVGEWRLVPFSIWPYCGNDSFVVWTLQVFADKTGLYSLSNFNNTNNWWLFTQPFLLLLAWLLRERLGNIVAKATAAV